MSDQPQSTTDAIATCLAALASPGSFATRMSAPTGTFPIEVTGVGKLRFPLGSRTIAKLSKVARPSHYGLRDKTLFDPDVRDALEIAKSRIKVPARPWNAALGSYLNSIAESLGLPKDSRLVPVLDKMHLYGPGQFFAPHQDSERSDEMVATLVILLPTQYTGGAFTVELRDQRKVFRRVKSQDASLSLLAFYADCQHAVAPVTSGVRVSLTYHLLLAERTANRGKETKPDNSCSRSSRVSSRTGTASAHKTPTQTRRTPKPPKRATTSSDLVDRLRDHFETPVRRGGIDTAPGRLVYLLDHEYTQRSLSWDRFKGNDRLRVSALVAAAEALECECYLALAEVQEIRDCRDVSGFHRRRRHYWSDWEREGWEQEPPPEPEFDIGDLIDENVQLHHWIGPDGVVDAGVEASAQLGELCYTVPSTALHPFKSEYEGFQGNYGNTMERWYHRAALVMWPKAKAFVLRAEYSPSWAIEALSQVQSSEELVEKVRSLLPIWTWFRLRDTDRKAHAKLMAVAARLDDGDLAKKFISPMGTHCLGSRVALRTFVEMVQRYGPGWGEDVFTMWAERHRWDVPAWIPHLPGICSELSETGEDHCAQLAEWLVKREADVVWSRCLAGCKYHRPWLDFEGWSTEGSDLAAILDAATRLPNSAAKLIESFLDTLLGTPDMPLALELQILRRSADRSPALRTALTSSALLTSCIDKLTAIATAPSRTSSDWSLEVVLPCSCDDCTQLSQFLRSKERARDWPLNKDRRHHIHGVLDSNALPVRHVTLRKGSPYVLQLEKEKDIRTREEEHRKRAKELLREISALKSNGRRSGGRSSR